MRPTSSIRRHGVASIPRLSAGKGHCATSRLVWDSTTTWREARGLRGVEHESGTRNKSSFTMYCIKLDLLICKSSVMEDFISWEVMVRTESVVI